MQNEPPPIPIHYVFLHNYEITLLKSPSLVIPPEHFHQFPARLEEQDRNGIYLQVSPRSANQWMGFFARGFDSQQVATGIYSCPDPGSLCVVTGGYAYVVDAANPKSWMQIEQRPVVEVKSVTDLKLLLFVGFTTITGLGESACLWTTQRLSWEGLSLIRIENTTLHGMAWDMIEDKEVPFEVDLLTGQSKGGARPHAIMEHGDHTAS